MTDAESAWLAGLLEGEGCFDWNRVQGRYPRIRIEMKDKDVIERAAALLGGRGAVRLRPAKKSSHSDTYKFQLADHARLREILPAILPWMGERRGAKVREMIAAL